MGRTGGMPDAMSPMRLSNSPDRKGAARAQHMTWAETDCNRPGQNILPSRDHEMLQCGVHAGCGATKGLAMKWGHPARAIPPGCTPGICHAHATPPTSLATKSSTRPTIVNPIVAPMPWQLNLAWPPVIRKSSRAGKKFVGRESEPEFPDLCSLVLSKFFF